VPLPRPADETLIRAVADNDAAQLIALIGAIWRSYPGIVFDVDAELPELYGLATVYAKAGGAGWVAERAGRIVGCVGVAPSSAPGGWEILKLYVAADERRRGLARRLVTLAEDFARAHGASALRLWTDTRFAEAHAFYCRLGYVQQGRRQLQDLSCTSEYGFYKAL